MLKTPCAKLPRNGAKPRLCYEAGSCGYGIQRQLSEAGRECVVVAPSLIPRKPGGRIKTDRRNAINLARLHRAGELTTVGVPDPAHEAIRDLARARLAAADPNQLLIVAVFDGRIIGTLQLSFIPGLARRGALRGQIEAVRIAADYRNVGLGRQMMDWAIAKCRSRGCALVQLTTDKSRPDAHRFYERLGFKASHEGYKLAL